MSKQLSDKSLGYVWNTFKNCILSRLVMKTPVSVMNSLFDIVFDFTKIKFDWCQVGRIRWQKDQMYVEGFTHFNYMVVSMDFWIIQ